jgi:hypothetical protein
VAPSALHERLRETLDAVAVLAGFCSSYPCALADGRRPDVLRYSTFRRLVFFGEAKAMESLNNNACFERLTSYLQWIKAAAYEPAGGVIAICTPSLSSARRWATTLELVCKEVQLVMPSTFAAPLGDCGLAWAECGTLIGNGSYFVEASPKPAAGCFDVRRFPHPDWI